MGCNCKNKIKEKYGITDADVSVEHRWWQKILIAIVQVGFGLVAGGLFTVLLIPFCLYTFFCLCVGKTPKFRIPDITKWKK